MPHTIILDKTSQIVTVSYSDKVALDERLQTVEEVCEQFSHLSPLKILIDVRKLIMDMPVSDQQKFGESLANHDGLKNAKVAVLHESVANPNMLIDIFAFNNGYKLAQFISEYDAKLWLTENI